MKQIDSKSDQKHPSIKPRYRGKSLKNLPLEQKANIVFNEVFKSFNEDLSKASPAERLNAAVQLASLFLKPNTKQGN